MINTKKCKSCGEWSEWSSQLTDTCKYCGALLSEEELHRHQKKEKEIEANDKSWMFHYEPNAPLFEKAYKKTGFVIYSIMMAIASFIAWIMFWLGP
jgi:predicted amidophosphoribosyltransferase